MTNWGWIAEGMGWGMLLWAVGAGAGPAVGAVGLGAAGVAPARPPRADAGDRRNLLAKISCPLCHLSLYSQTARALLPASRSCHSGRPPLLSPGARHCAQLTALNTL